MHFSCQAEKWGYVAVSLLLSFPASATLSTEGHGRVSMTGTIIDTACDIATSSREQYIEIGDLSIGQIIRDGRGPTRSFSIHLVNCVLERAGRKNWETFQVTFDGLRDEADFGVSGDASGISLRITDADGHQVTPGQTQPRKDIHPRKMTLDYHITPVTNREQIKPGDYSSIVKFKLDYF